MKRAELVGAMCPVCRTVQDWTGAGIFRASIVCRGGGFVDRHDTALVVSVSPFELWWERVTRP